MRGTTMMGGALAVALVLGGASLASAQSTDAPKAPNAAQPGSGMDGKIIGAGSGSAAGAAGSNIISTGQGGVAGTGLGKMPAGSSMGTGQTVKGPAGQGISNSTDIAK